MLRRAALVSTDISEEQIASIRVTRIGELETTLEEILRNVRRLPVTGNVVPSSPGRVSLMMEAMFLRNVGYYKSHTA
jgi:hypothetical protein